MRRALPLLLVVPLLAACAAARGGGSSVIRYGPHVHRSDVTPVAVTREHAAFRQAGALLRRVAVPAGSVRLWHQPAGDANDLSQSGLGVSVVEMTADRYAYWRLPGSGDALDAFEKHHPPAGLHWGLGNELYGRNAVGSPGLAVSFTVVPLGGRTIVRVDAGAAWIYPRSPREVVPAGVRAIVVNGGGVYERVTEPAKVARIVRWFDALHAFQPGPGVGCAATIAARVTFAFRSASGARLANAVVPAAQATNCDTIQFSVGGKPQMSLIDAPSRKQTFASRVQRLLGVRFRPAFR